MSGGRLASKSRVPAAGSREKKQAKPAVEVVAVPRRWLEIAAGILALIFLMGLFTTEIADTDFWWQLKTGQYVVQTHSLPLPDPFAYTTAIAAQSHPGEELVRHFNLTHEWASQALMYVAYSIGGFALLVLIRGAMLTAGTFRLKRKL